MEASPLQLVLQKCQVSLDIVCTKQLQQASVPHSLRRSRNVESDDKGVHTVVQGALLILEEEHQ